MREEEAGLFMENVQDIFNKVPCGIVLYKWDGRALSTIRMSDYFVKQYGITGPDCKEKVDAPNFLRVHPDDIVEYEKAIKQGLREKKSLKYIFRLWNNGRKDYVWTQIDARYEMQSDGTGYIYAVYTDVSEQKEAESDMKKSHTSLISALRASNQLCYEYDPVKHTGVCFTEENYFNLPKFIPNYPDSLRHIDLFYPDDTEIFIQTAHKIDRGDEKAQCDVRIKKNGQYCWYSCMFDSYYDSQKGYRVAILTVVDISLRIASIQVYEERLRSMVIAKEQVLSICSINLSQNTFDMIGMETVMEDFVDENLSFEVVMLGIVDHIVGDEEKERYRNTFSRDSLLTQAEKGEMHIQQEILLKIEDGHYEWVNVVVDMARNPVSGEVGGIAYSESSQLTHMANELLWTTLQQDYIFAAVVFKDTDEFYLYYSERGEFSSRMENFWQVALKTPQPKCTETTMEYLQKSFEKEKMLEYLEKNNEFRYAYDSMYTGKECRIEIKFRYLDKKKTMLFASLRNITDTMLLEKWHYESEHDLLTGLLNRKTVFEQCRQMLDEGRYEKYVMLHCDIRHFHLYNTFFGEKAGDDLLCEIARIICTIGNDYDQFTCGRIESDVFCVFFPIDTNIFESHIRSFFRQIADYCEDFPLEPAIGVYVVSDRSMDMEAMFSRATIAAKSKKRNLFQLVSVYDEEMDQNLTDTQQVTSEMHQAISGEQFEVYLQPKYSLDSEEMVGAEALVRWNHPQRGMIYPGKFIPEFEKNGFITELDRYMWEHVCQILQNWSREGRKMYPISVNLSRVSMYSHATVPFLKNLINKYELDPKYLELELTESAYMDDPEELKRMLAELQAFGFKILMDDFGSGYSSLNILRELPVDVLKLDMRFLSDMKENDRGTTVLASVVRMSKLLHLPTIAEGVEKKEQAEYLRSIGCDYVQGFLYARPMPVDEYEKLLDD